MTTHRHGPPRMTPRRITACAAAVALLVAGCTSTTADDPTRATASKSPTAPTPSVLDISPSPNSPNPREGPASSLPATNSNGTAGSPDPAAQEAADRAAVEAQWTRFWIVYDQIVRTPRETRKEELGSVAEADIVASILKAADDADSQGIDNYGTWTHRLSWQFPIGGSSTAVIADCQDQSMTGTYEVESGKILTVGKERSSMRGEFTKDSDGIWRLKQLYLLGDQEC